MAVRSRVGVVVIIAAVACGARTELDAVAPADGSSHDVAQPVDASDSHAPDAHDSADVCDFGTIVADAFGATEAWNGGAALPPGHYRVTYADGCMKYSSAQAWTVNAYANGPDTLYVVTDANARISPAPGTVGFYQGQGGFNTFSDCVTTNLSTDAPLEFDFGGGTLGLWLADGPYTDNVAGDNGRNPTYRLSSCP